MELLNYQSNLYQSEIDNAMKRIYNHPPNANEMNPPNGNIPSNVNYSYFETMEFNQNLAVHEQHPHHIQQIPNQDMPHPQHNLLPPQEINQEQMIFDILKSKSNSLPELKTNLLEFPERANSFPIQHHHDGPSDHPGIDMPINLHMNQYPDITTFVNANSNIAIPLVDAQFVDHKVCSICGKRITRDMSRHMRTHQSESRFTCKFPKHQCRHKSGKFNRPYDFKKHLLNRHFIFDNVSIKRLHNLSDKVNHWGACPCGLRFTGKDWLKNHILTEDVSKKCTYIE